MSLLTAAELAQLQADFAAAVCDLSCQIQRWNISTKTWPTQATVNCGMSEPTAGQLTNYEYMIGDLATWHNRFPFGTDVRELDRLVISLANGATKTLSVVKLLQPRSYTALISVLATE